MATKKKPRTMSPEHKAALADGRSEGRVVKKYLDALEATKPKPGRKRTQDSIKKRLDNIAVELEAADPLKRLKLTQERLNLTKELTAKAPTVDVAAAEKEFIKVAKGYAERQKLTYGAFRAVGVSAAVLKAAGISRGA